MHQEPDKFLDARELADYLHLGIATINNLQRDGVLPLADFVVGRQNKRLWKLEKINKWMAENCQNPKKEQSA